ncbi:sulfatase-like hydrolase/transferase, partial [Armatimonas sp.]|uniref:sulfatase-like hydrolase/transferase n=1 Tax=Armatimonas sp. TaxID=1872638 RepID=UPI0037536661
MRLLLTLWALLSGALVASAQATNRYNVLFIAVDDLRPELGCYGVKEAQSPHIDRLAKSGMLFTRHYAAVATCGASRYALLTGRSPARSGVTANNEA